MKDVAHNLYVGSDRDALLGLVRRGWALLSACKDGPYGHRAVLGYLTAGAPKDQDYLWVEKGDHMALNLIDSPNPDFISGTAIDAGCLFIEKHLGKGNKVLVHCNEGISRGPTVAMIYLWTRGLMRSAVDGRHLIEIFKENRYPAYEPGPGVQGYVNERVKGGIHA